MAGQATMMTRDEVRSAIKKVECNKNTAGNKTPKMSMKTTKKQ